jgi:glycine oxidase
MVDFIIVGRGLAANVIAHTFYNEGVSFKLIGDPGLSKCSSVAAGIWNPVVFKRMSLSWLASGLIPELLEFYSECERTLGAKLITQRQIIKPFNEEHEKTLWKKKAMNELSEFADSRIHENIPDRLSKCKIPNGYGILNQCGNLDLNTFLNASSDFFRESSMMEIFDHSLVKLGKHGITYKNIEAANIIFCEGHLVCKNSFFNWIPLKPAKGEILTIEADLDLENDILNKNGFLMQTGNKIFKTGATYEWQQLDDQPTEKGRKEVCSRLDQMISCAYKVIDHEAGVRPSSIDRRPIIGAHPEHKNMFVFNGLGTKGVMLAPFFAKKFVNFCLRQEKMMDEVDVKRFYHLYGSKKSPQDQGDRS